MVQIPLPGVAPDAGQSGFFIAPETAPRQDYTGQGLAQLGEGLTHAGGEAARIADFLQDQVDDAKTTEARNRASDVHRKALYDPETGFLHKRGKAANAKERENTFQTLDEEIRKIEDSLDNDVQKEQFRKHAQAMWVDSSQKADVHQAAGAFEHKWGAMSAAADAERVDGHLDGMKGWVAKLSEMAGDDEQEARMRMLEATTAFHEQEIRNAAPQDPPAAAQYLQDHKQEIDPKRQDDLRRIIKAERERVRTEGVQQKGQDQFLKMLDAVRDQGGTDAEQMQFAQEAIEFTRKGQKQPAEVMNVVQQHFDHYFQRQANIKLQAKAATQDEVETFYAKNPTGGLAALRQTPELWNKVTASGVLPQAIQIARQAKAEHYAKSDQQIELGKHLQSLADLSSYVEALKVESTLVGKDPVKKVAIEKKVAQYSQMHSQLLLAERVLSLFGIPGYKPPLTPEQVAAKQKEQLTRIKNALQGVGK